MSEEDEPVVRNKRGCPCSETCCNKPRPFSPHNVCDENCERFCEDSYGTECASCGAYCACDL